MELKGGTKGSISSPSLISISVWRQFRHTLHDIISIVLSIVNSLVKHGETSPGKDTNPGKASSRQLQATQVYHTVPVEGKFGVDWNFQNIPKEISETLTPLFVCNTKILDIFFTVFKQVLVFSRFYQKLCNDLLSTAWSNKRSAKNFLKF